ncbi:unnamed protein product [Prunus armeniaca]|uniref:Retrotransposon gag domain-containing protein n=1 Tax=Prunus armeniaca TaxID=36596 RepID=A0A6J5W3L2_PRUAR|nr:unnamed protein product [Prunus armeniaca]
MAGVEGQNENDVSDSMRIMLAIQDMASAIRKTNQQNHEPHQETQDDRIMRIQGEFRKTRPPVFKGDPNPMAAEEWLRQMKRKMNEQRVPGNLKVTIASTYLEGQAYHWWESILAMPDVEVVTWVAFETMFMEKYFPETMKTMKVREFTNLYQGDMTVGQYQAKFEELMRFAPYMIPDESAKAKKFEEGLRLEVKEKIPVAPQPQPQFRAPQQQFQAPQTQYRAPYQAPYQDSLNQFRGPVNQQTQRPRGQPTRQRPRAPGTARKSEQLTQGQVYAVGQVTEPNEPTMVEGTFLVFNSWARILFDPDATNSFISVSFASILGIEYEFMKSSLMIGLQSMSNNKSIQRHTYRGLISSPISPQCIIQTHGPILPCGVHCLLKYVLNLPITYLNLPTSLRIIGCCHLVRDSIFLRECYKSLVNKVGATITNDCSRCVKPCSNISIEKTDHHLSIISSSGNGFHPFGNIIDSN